MNTAGDHIMPPAGSHDMTDRVCITVSDDFGISCCSAAETHQHRIGCFLFGIPRIIGCATAELCIKITPAFSGAIHDHFHFHRIIAQTVFDRLRDAAVGSCDHSRDARTFETVIEIFCHQLITDRNCNCADTMQRIQDEPILIMAFQHQHNTVAAFDSKKGKIICRTHGIFRNIFVCEIFPVVIAVKPDQSGSGWHFFCQCIQNIIGKVEVVRIMEFDVFQIPVFVQRFIHEFVADQVFARHGFRFYCRFSIRQQILFHCIPFVHERKERTGLITVSNHTVRMTGIVNDAVSGIHDFDFITQLDLQLSGQDVIEFLSGMGGKVDFILPGRLRGSSHKERFAETFFEVCSEVLIFKVMPAFDRHTAIFSGERIKR